MGGMALFPPHLLVVNEDLVDDGLPGRSAAGRVAAGAVPAAGRRPAPGAPCAGARRIVSPIGEWSSRPRNRAGSVRTVPLSVSCSSRQRCRVLAGGLTGGANSSHRKGPNQSSEVTGTGQPVTTVTNPALFRVGRNCLVATVTNISSGSNPTGLALRALVTGGQSTNANGRCQ